MCPLAILILVPTDYLPCGINLHINLIAQDPFCGKPAASKKLATATGRTKRFLREVISVPVVHVSGTVENYVFYIFFVMEAFGESGS